MKNSIHHKTKTTTLAGYDYVYQYKDHLGNIRLSYTDSDNNGTITTSEIIEENNYYPFGLKHKGYNNVVNGVENNYKTYNGKELNESLGLNNVEMDYRQYDPAIGRFNVIDAASELVRNWTPYRFAFNNPIFFSDPTGLWEKKKGSWYTNDKKDIERFLNMLSAEQAFNGNVSGAQMDLFIKEEYQGSGGRLSDGSALLDEETISVSSKTGKSEGFKRKQIRNISRQITNFVMNPYNEKSMGSQGHWAYSYN